MNHTLLKIGILGSVLLMSASAQAQSSRQCGDVFSGAFARLSTAGAATEQIGLEALFPTPYDVNRVGRAERDQGLMVSYATQTDQAMRYRFTRDNQVFEKISAMLAANPGQVFTHVSGLTATAVAAGNEISITWREPGRGSQPQSFRFLKKSQPEAFNELIATTQGSSELRPYRDEARLFEQMFADRTGYNHHVNTEAFNLLVSAALRGDQTLTLSNQRVRSFDEFDREAHGLRLNRIFSSLPANLASSLEAAAAVLRSRGTIDGQNVSYTWNDLDNTVSMRRSASGPVRMKLTSQAVNLEIEVNSATSEVTLSGVIDKYYYGRHATRAQRSFTMMINPNGVRIEGPAARSNLESRFALEIDSLLLVLAH